MRGLPLSTAIAVAMTALVARGAEAGPCVGAVEGTFESNVCWLMETNFDEVTDRVKLFLVEAQTYQRLALAFGQALTSEDRRELRDLTTVESLSEADCTVTYATMGDRNTISLNRVRSVAWESAGRVVRYALRGDDFSSDGRREVVFFGDGVTQASARRALGNLYSRYCDGLRSEF